MKKCVALGIWFVVWGSACQHRSRSSTDTASVNSRENINVESGSKDFPGDELLLIEGDKGELAVARTAPKMSISLIRNGNSDLTFFAPVLRSFSNKIYRIDLNEAGPKIEIFSPDSMGSPELISIPSAVFGLADLQNAAKSGEIYTDIHAQGGGADPLLIFPEKPIIYRLTSARKFEPVIDLGSAIHGKLQLRGLSSHLGLIYVVLTAGNTAGQRETSKIAVIDVAKKAVIKTIDLEGSNPLPTLELDVLRKKLWVVTAGQDHGNDGAIQRIDIDGGSSSYLKLDFREKLPTFEGTVALGKDYLSLFYLEHTATPTTSTHMKHVILNAAGEIESKDKSPTQGLDLTAAFESSETLQTTENRDLAAVSFNCRYFACPRGAGIYFFDGVSGMPFRKVYAAGKFPPDVSPQPEVTIPFLVSNFVFLRRQ